MFDPLGGSNQARVLNLIVPFFLNHLWSLGNNSSHPPALRPSGILSKATQHTFQTLGMFFGLL
jgi:hypothetical protein